MWTNLPQRIKRMDAALAASKAEAGAHFCNKRCDSDLFYQKHFESSENRYQLL